MLKLTPEILKDKLRTPTTGYNGLKEDSLKSKESQMNSKTKDVMLMDFSLDPLRTTLMLLKLLDSSSLISVDT